MCQWIVGSCLVLEFRDCGVEAATGSPFFFFFHAPALILGLGSKETSPGHLQRIFQDVPPTPHSEASLDADNFEVTVISEQSPFPAQGRGSQSELVKLLLGCTCGSLSSLRVVLGS